MVGRGGGQGLVKKMDCEKLTIEKRDKWKGRKRSLKADT